MEAVAGDAAVVISVGEDRLEVASGGFADVTPGFDLNSMPNVMFMMSSATARKFGDFTSRHVGEAMDFWVCGRKVMSPTIIEPIFGGAGQISGNFTVEETVKLAAQMKTGYCTPVSALPLRVLRYS